MTFFYFAYGSNLLSKRMHINCPSATKRTIGVLKKFRLAFSGFADEWKGSVATIVEDNDSNVWGVVWEIHKNQEECLDRQEQSYLPISVTVQTIEGEQIPCKTYRRILSSSERESLPSVVYKSVIIQGAVEYQLPDHYLQKLRNIKDNGYSGPVDIHV